MSKVKIQIKWAGKKSAPATAFKATLQALTAVPPDRQKIMLKGGILKDDTDMTKVGIKDGASVMMMGSAEVVEAPKEQIKFAEDLTEGELNKALDVPSGLVNLGNTCYLNSTLQTLRAIPELTASLSALPGTLGLDNRKNIPLALSKLYGDLEKTGDAVPPLVFLQVLRGAFPQFAEQGRGGYMQQDAEEALGSIVSCLKDGVPGSGPGKTFVEEYMTGHMERTLVCDEAPEEPPTESFDTFVRLPINISGGVVTYLTAELASSLTEKLEKHSATLDRSASYTQTSKISRLPKYLTFQFIRFQWKPAERVRAKILKRVKFPFDLDMLPYVTPELAKKMVPAKDRIRQVEDRKAEEKKSKKGKEPENGKAPVPTTEMEVDSVPVTTKSEQDVMRELNLDQSLVDDVGACVHGQYELIAVITHLGRTADGGHYIAWVKKGDDTWHKFDDDKVTPVPAEEITKLEGGGEYHSAYICLYKAKVLE